MGVGGLESCGLTVATWGCFHDFVRMLRCNVWKIVAGFAQCVPFVPAKVCSVLLQGRRLQCLVHDVFQAFWAHRWPCSRSAHGNVRRGQGWSAAESSLFALATESIYVGVATRLRQRVLAVAAALRHCLASGLMGPELLAGAGAFA